MGSWQPNCEILGNSRMGRALFCGRSGMRVSRLRPEEEWVRVEVPELRFIDDDLWAKVKARQDSFQVKPRRGSNSGGVGPRPKFLLSGFLRCAKCGGPMTIAGTVHKRYYCKTAKEQGPSQCTG
ncbi:MAG TPA: hypothetical protein EYQ81_16540, partial [Sneathiellales bacterium]|nr:hypothetical protein [Sneathiellales bacterium]